MIVTTLLNIWLLLTAAIDPGVAPFSYDRFEEPCSSQHQLQRRPPLNIPVLVFSQAADVGVTSESFSELTVALLDGVSEYVRQTQNQCHTAFLNMAASLEKAIAESEAVIFNWQAELIIARLERAVQRKGSKSDVAIQGWEDYEKLIQEAESLTIGDVNLGREVTVCLSKRLDRDLLRGANDWVNGMFGMISNLNSWVSRHHQNWREMVQQFRFGAEERRFPRLDWEADVFPLGTILDCE